MARQSTQKLTRAQIREGLDTIPIESLLSSGQGKQPKLTAKMKNFAHAVALGQTKASAYRGSYKATATKRTMASKPYELAKDGRIQREILAVQAALQAAQHRTPVQIKALLVQQLVQHSLDDDFPPASRVQCLKLLGQLYEVGAFVEHKQITTVHRSDDIRTRLLSRLQAITVDADIVADDALDLLAEIKQGRPDPANTDKDPAPATEGHPAGPTAGAPPLSGQPRTGEPIHTIPLKRSSMELKRSQEERSHPLTLPESEIVDDFDK